MMVGIGKEFREWIGHSALALLSTDWPLERIVRVWVRKDGRGTRRARSAMMVTQSEDCR